MLTCFSDAVTRLWPKRHDDPHTRSALRRCIKVARLYRKVGV